MSPPRTCLQLDVGNSSAKWRLRVDGETRGSGLYRKPDEASRQALLGCTPALDAVWISSVASEAVESQLCAMLAARWDVDPWMARSEAETLGLKNSYEDPRRMGVDRWLAMLASRARYPGERLCVVDAGSALTIDLVNAEGCHEGGYIIPGPQLMERALLLDTGRVRFSETAEYDLAPGTSTAQAVRHGIALAQAGAVSMALVRASEETPPRVIYTGGGGEWLAKSLAAGPEAYAADLVLEGLEAAGIARSG